MSNLFPDVAAQADAVSNSPTGSEPYTQTSVAAVTSMVFGIMSPIVLCTCLPAIVTSAAAVVLGHVALFKIGRSNGVLIGKNRAITGLVLGYLFLALSIYLAPNFFSRIQAWRDVGSSIADAGATDAMWAAERKIISDSQGVFHGNNPQARDLARKYSVSLKQMKDQIIIRMVNGKIDEKNDQFITYCQLNNNSVCFLVHIPEYRKYESDAKSAIAEAAWLAAIETTATSSLENAEMGVGLKGILFYGSAMTGTTSNPVPVRKSEDRGTLVKFFEEVEELDLGLDIEMSD